MKVVMIDVDSVKCMLTMRFYAINYRIVHRQFLNHLRDRKSRHFKRLQKYPQFKSTKKVTPDFT